MDALAAQLVTTMLEGFLYDESHAHQFRASLLHQVHDAFGSVSVGKEVVDEKHLVAGREEILLTHTSYERCLVNEYTEVTSIFSIVLGFFFLANTTGSSSR